MLRLLKLIASMTIPILRRAETHRVVIIITNIIIVVVIISRGRYE